MKKPLWLLCLSALLSLPTVSQAVVDATLTKNVADARIELAKDEKALNELKAKLQKDFESSEDWTSAQAALTKAQADHKAAADPVLLNLTKTAEYKAASDKLERAQETLQTLKQNQAVSTEQLTSASEAVIVAQSELRALEQKTLASAPAVADAEKREAAAKDAIRKLKAKFEDSLKANTDYDAAQKLVDTDREKMNTAQKALNDAQANERKNPTNTRPNPTPRKSTPTPPARKTPGSYGR